MPKFYLITGIPGSGKSTLARQMLADDKTNSTVWFEADMYFERSGKYIFNPTALPAAHGWCQRKAREAMEQGLNVIVSNTSLTPWERAPYLKMIKEFNYEYEVIHCTGEYQNIHDCPPASIERMKKKYVPFSIEEFNNI